MRQSSEWRESITFNHYVNPEKQSTKQYVAIC